MEELQHSCAFIGHQPNKLPWMDTVKDPRFVTFRKCLKGQMAALADSGITDFYSGMSDGTSIWAAKGVLELRRDNPTIRLHCIIPYDGLEENWSVRSQVLFYRTRCCANEIKKLSQDYYDGCLMDRNKYMVDQAGTLLAVYNGDPSGETAETIRYARQLNRKIIIIDPTTWKISRDE